MLRFIVHAEHRLTILPYLREWAGDLAARVEVIGYDELFRARRLPLCTHVFTDLERLSPEERESAAHVWHALAAAPSPVRLLNHPLRAMRRYELLRHLHEQGLNDFDAVRLTDARKPSRFPVFVRVENDHLGPESPLLDSPEALEAHVESLRRAGKCPDARIAVEFCAEPSADGVYRKYGAFCVDDEIIPRHVLFSTGWLVKGKTKVFDDYVVDEERRWLEHNPHRDHVARVFRSAHIDYGRADYAIVGGRIQVYEINTNPTIINEGRSPRTEKKQRFTDAITAALRRIEAQSLDGAGPRVRTFAPDRPLKGWRARVASRVCQSVLGRQLRTPI
jgi:hypothetical protein